MSEPDFDAAIDHALQRLQDELSPALTYHNLWHTRDDVMPATERLALACGLPAHERRLLVVAAAYHDIGFVCQYENHERAGAEIAAELLPRFGFMRKEISRIASLILATRLGARPERLSQAILADADLDVLGREDFLARGQLLWQELLAVRPASSRQIWLEEQVAFLQRHRYFTPAARALREPGKQRNRRLLDELVRQELAGPAESPEEQ